jgi:hypothetical protein
LVPGLDELFGFGYDTLNLAVTAAVLIWLYTAPAVLLPARPQRGRRRDRAGAGRVRPLSDSPAALGRHRRGVAASPDTALVRDLGTDVIVEPGDKMADQIRSQLPSGAPGLIGGAALDALALPAVADDGGSVTLKGWSGPSERGIVSHPISSFVSATDTELFDWPRTQAEAGILTLRVADVLAEREAAEAHRRLAGGGVRGRLVLDFSQPL